MIGGVARFTSGSNAASPQFSPRGSLQEQNMALWASAAGADSAQSSYFAAGSPGTYAVGTVLEVWSKTRGAWCTGKVGAILDSNCVKVDFTLPDGTAAGKILPMNHEELRPLLSLSRRGSPSRMRSVSPDPAMMRQVSPVPAMRRQASLPMPVAPMPVAPMPVTF